MPTEGKPVRRNQKTSADARLRGNHPFLFATTPGERLFAPKCL
jgi:hypothetical protein